MKKPMLLSAVLLTTLLCFPVLLTAQKAAADIPFNGLITDSAGKGIKAKIAVKHSDKRTIADKTGKFGLTNLSPTDTLIVQFKSDNVEIPLAGRRSLKIRWQEKSPSYEEDESLVDSGFGYVKRREYTSSSSGLNGEELVRRGFTDLQTAILTLVPGVQLINGELVIRGQSSVNSSSAALIVCDGVPIQNLGGINIHDVKSIEVQRGSNMYGVRGGNGVILIRTRDK